MQSLAVVILTKNEEDNIVKCLASVAPLRAAVYVIDSGSTDRTVEIARRAGATVIERQWTTHADQFNWALEHAGIEAEWTMRLDADEELTPELVAALRELLRDPPAGIAGLYVRRRVRFMGRWIRHGGFYPTWLLRVWRTGCGRCESVHMDEHIVVSGETMRLAADIVDDNNKGLTFWTAKHNNYASLEVADILRKERREQAAGEDGVRASLRGPQESSKRWLKDNFYLRLPLFVRPFLYFSYRYFVRLGFLDGTRGLIFHFLQAFWYRFLVDAKLHEHRIRSRRAAPATASDGRAPAPGRGP